jgi:hypothetical protein
VEDAADAVPRADSRNAGLARRAREKRVALTRQVSASLPAARSRPEYPRDDGDRRASVLGTGVRTDTYYMENWGDALPGGLSQLSYPMKVYRNRRRAANHGYTPAIPNDQLDNTAAVQVWIRGLSW